MNNTFMISFYREDLSLSLCIAEELLCFYMLIYRNFIRLQLDSSCQSSYLFHEVMLATFIGLLMKR